MRHTGGLGTWFWLLIPRIVTILASACAECHPESHTLLELANKVSPSDT